MKKIIINKDLSVKDAIKQMSHYGFKCLIVCNDKNEYLGTLSDGDIRKSFIKENSINTKIEKIFKKNSYYFYENSFDKRIIEKTFKNKKIDIIPIINKSKKVIKVFFQNSEETSIPQYKKIKNTSVVIMSGGIGSRVRPYTHILPKPLLIYKNKTLLENIIENFSNYNLKDFFISINYKSELIKSYFSEIKKDYNVKFLEEDKPLGTFGSLKLLNNSKEKDFFVINCDTIIQTDLDRLYRYHKNQKNDFTIVLVDINIEIPYGVCSINKNSTLKKIIEKPNTNYKINSGLYLINSKSLCLIPNSKKMYNFEDFVHTLRRNNKKIGTYIIDQNSWEDLGQISSFNNKNN
jgi:dTDP-glucose pyrophosphorylase